MKKITHISVIPGDDAQPDDPPKAVYVDPPEDDVLEEKPFGSGRHRIERTPEGDDEKPAATLWSWTEGDG
jgi:hypothetical protein